MAKKSIAGSSSETQKKKKKSSKKGPNGVAMKLKAPKENPFETIWSRRKFDFAGKKKKGEERRVGLARSRAIEKRKKTLLKEYEQSRKSSVFLDKRIGEQNDVLGEFDKAILRSQRERQIKLKRKSKYNLSDGEEDEFPFLGGDDFAEEVEPDDDEYENRPANLKQIYTHATKESLDDGLAEEEETRTKSKKEVMEEVIMKSKFYKAQKAKQKQETLELIEKLDKDFASLVQSEAMLSLSQPNKMNGVKVHANQSILTEGIKESGVPASGKSDIPKQEKRDPYDILASEIIFEPRTLASDRTKTLEELQEEERERLEELEQKRQERMLPHHDSSDEDVSEDADGASAKWSRPVSGDDLGDSLSHDKNSVAKKGWVDKILERDNNKDLDDEDGSSSASESDGKDGSSSASESDDGGEEETDKENEVHDEIAETLKDWEQSDDNLDTDLEEDEEEVAGVDDIEFKRNLLVNDSEIIKKRKTDPNSEAKKTEGEKMTSQKQDVPLVIDAPSSMEEFLSLLENRSNQEIDLVIHRICVHNPVAKHRKQMQIFYGLLLQFFATLTTKKPLNFELLNILVKPLMEISMQIPYFSAICARERILRTRTRLCEDIKDPEKSSWPSFKTLILLRLWSMIYPCSDFRHPVMTPALLLMSEYLMRCPILSGRDVAVGSFLCSMVLAASKRSKKFFPEALIFLKALLHSALDRDPKSCYDSQRFSHVLELKAPESMLCIRDNVDGVLSLEFLKIVDLPEDSAFFSSDEFRAGILASVVDSLQGFVEIYGELKAFPEIFLPVSTLLLEVSRQPNVPNFLLHKMRDLSEIILTKVDEHHRFRQPLQMRKQKPEPIPTLRPKIEENFVKGRDYDPDRARAEEKKLKKLVNQERKGAIREVRKDNYFLHEVKEKERAQLEAEKTQMRGKMLAFLQEQEHAAKSGQLGKRRRGRR